MDTQFGKLVQQILLLLVKQFAVYKVCCSNKGLQRLHCLPCMLANDILGIWMQQAHASMALCGHKVMAQGTKLMTLQLQDRCSIANPFGMACCLMLPAWL